MVEVGIQPIEASVAKMQKDLADVQRLMGRTAPQAVTWAAQLFARSAAAAAKPGAKLREVKPDPTTGGKSFVVTVLRQDAPARFLKVPTRNDPTRTIERRGLSRNVWKSLEGIASSFKPSSASGSKSSSFDVFNAIPNTAKGRVRRRRMHAAFSLFFNPDIAESKIMNELSYQREAYPELEATAMFHAERALRHRLDQALGIVK